MDAYLDQIKFFGEKLVRINNTEGKEDIVQTLLNEAPKFGNNIDRVDLLAGMCRREQKTFSMN